MVDLNVENRGIKQVILSSKTTFPADIGGVKLLPDDNKKPGMVISIAASQASASKAIVTVSVVYRDGQGNIAPDGSSHGEFEFSVLDGKWTCTKTLKNVIK